MLSIDVLEKGADVPQPIWQMRNQHFGMWDEAQVRIGETGTAFKVYVTAERGDNSGTYARTATGMDGTLFTDF